MALPGKGLVPALDSRCTNAMRTRQLALCDATIVGFKDLQPEHFRGTQSGADAGYAMPKITIALQAVVLGYP